MTDDKKPRKPRADSKEQAVKTMIAATGPAILPPDDMHCDPSDLRIFNEIISEFARADWSDHCIRLAFMLARTMNDMQMDMAALRIEGSVIENARHTPIMNPRRTACQGYAGQIMALRRSLALHATAGSSKASEGKGRAIRKGQESDNPLHDDDENLLNRPEGHA